MPEMFFRILWPDASETNHYSPSLVIRDFFTSGDDLEIVDFLDKIRDAMTIASDRVKAKYGFACARAHGTLAEIEAQAHPFAARPNARVKILQFS